MVFIRYEPGSKANQVHDLATRHVHVTRVAVFDEAAIWKCGENSTASLQDLEDFVVEYTVASESRATTHRTPRSAAGTEEEGDKDTRGESESASPPSPD
jgi:hypothetical protein